MRTRKASRTVGSLLVAFYVFTTSAATAHAECAWVLWQEHRKVGTSWQERAFLFEHAYTIREECEQRRGAANAIAGSDNEIKATGRIPDDGIRRFYQCVPDTVDPRGPKTR